MGLFGRKRKPLTMKQRRKKLELLREEARLLGEETKVSRQVQKERQEIRQLADELHPSKVKRLAHLLGKAEHGAVDVGHAFARAHKKVHEARLKFEEKIEEAPPGLMRFKEVRKKKR